MAKLLQEFMQLEQSRARNQSWLSLFDSKIQCSFIFSTYVGLDAGNKKDKTAELKVKLEGSLSVDELREQQEMSNMGN